MDRARQRSLEQQRPLLRLGREQHCRALRQSYCDAHSHRRPRHLFYAESTDGGRTWPEFATKSDIPNPGSKATLYSLPGGPSPGNTVALVHNPNPVRGQRTPLALWISFDGLKTWPYRRVLVAESADGPKGKLNYPDGFVSRDGEWLHFAFDDNRHRAVYYGAKLPLLPQPQD